MLVDYSLKMPKNIFAGEHALENLSDILKAQRYNSTAKTSLNFKSPNEIVSEYFSKCNICLDN